MYENSYSFKTNKKTIKIPVLFSKKRNKIEILRHIREFYVSYSLISQKDKTISSRISSLTIWKNK
jgi:hypothetical protein